MATWIHLARWMELASALFMTGLIWFVQVVHYPLFAKVGATSTEYQRAHMERTSWVVAAPMLTELAAGLGLAVLRVGPAWQRWPATGLLVMVWASTALLQVPAHDALVVEFRPAVHQRLVSSNWLRTLAWTARAGLCLAAMISVPG